MSAPALRLALLATCLMAAPAVVQAQAAAPSSAVAPAAAFELAPLPYGYDGLEPVIDA